MFFFDYFLAESCNNSRGSIGSLVLVIIIIIILYYIIKLLGASNHCFCFFLIFFILHSVYHYYKWNFGYISFMIHLSFQSHFKEIGVCMVLHMCLVLQAFSGCVTASNFI